MGNPIVRTTDDIARPRNEHGGLISGALWGLQLLLAVVFALVGWSKITKPIADVRAAVSWMVDVPLPLVRVIGVCEVLGAIGLVLPAATRIRPRLTALAATCLTAIMVLAVLFHLYRGDTVIVLVPALLGFTSALVAWGRLRKAPTAARDAAE
jgi:putative oxidoreductase